MAADWVQAGGRNGRLQVVTLGSFLRKFTTSLLCLLSLLVATQTKTVRGCSFLNTLVQRRKSSQIHV